MTIPTLIVRYVTELPNFGDLLTVKEFMESCDYGGFIDYDGYGYPAREVKGTMLYAPVQIYPSIRILMPEDATHIIWFNR